MKTSKPLMTFDVVTLMPEMFSAICDYGITGRAFKDDTVNLKLWNPREFSKDIHKTVDDRTYGTQEISQRIFIKQWMIELTAEVRECL